MTGGLANLVLIYSISSKSILGAIWRVCFTSQAVLKLMSVQDFDQGATAYKTLQVITGLMMVW